MSSSVIILKLAVIPQPIPSDPCIDQEFAKLTVAGVSNALKDYKINGEKWFRERAIDEKFEHSPTRFKFFHTNKASSTGSHQHLHGVERQPEGVQVVEGVGLVRTNVFVLEKPWFRVSEFQNFFKNSSLCPPFNILFLIIKSIPNFVDNDIRLFF